MGLLHMKISDLLLEPDLDFLRFPKHKTGWGVRWPGYLHPHPVLLTCHAVCYLCLSGYLAMPCDMLLRSIK